MKFAGLEFPPFDLSRLLETVFNPRQGEKICVLIDLDDPTTIKDYDFLKNDRLTIQHHAYEVFYKGLHTGVMSRFGMTGGDLFAYKTTGGSNLDMDDDAWDVAGKNLSFISDIYANFDIILCVSTFSATAPLTADCKKYNFRGATLHGLNPIILNSGLSVDYNEVSAEAEKLRLGMTQLKKVEIDFKVDSRNLTLEVVLNGQEAQKSHGLC